MTRLETKRPRSDLTRPVRSDWALIELVGSVSPASDGEGVGVVAQDRPSGPDLPAFVSLEPGSVHTVAAFEVTDPALGAGSVARQPSLGAPAAGLLAAGDEHPLGGEAVIVERLAGRAQVEAAVERYLAGSDPEPGQLADRVGQQRVLGGVPQPGRGWDDQPARSAPGVLGHFADLTDVPEFVGLAELTLPDGPGVRVGDRDQPVDDRLPRDPLLDLGGDLLAPIRELLQLRRRPALGGRATPDRAAPGRRRELARFGERSLQQLAGLLGQREHLGLGLPGAPPDR